MNTTDNSTLLSNLAIAPLTQSEDASGASFAVGPATGPIAVSPPVNSGVLPPAAATPVAVPVTTPVDTTAPTRPIVELPTIETTSVWGVDFAIADMQQVIERADQVIASRTPSYFITANLNYVMLTSEHPDLGRVNRDADMVIADGNPIVWRSRLSLQRLPERVAGSDMIVELAKLSAAKGYRIYFLGAAPGVAQKAADKLQSMFPGLQVAGCAAPPFRELSEQEQASLLSTITAASPDILLVAFGQPKGERWIYQHYQQLGIPLCIQLGASFDFLAGTARRAPYLWQKLGCEWLYRSLCEPKRLVPRYAKNIAFLFRKLTSDFT